MTVLSCPPSIQILQIFKTKTEEQASPLSLLVSGGQVKDLPILAGREVGDRG